MQFILLKFIYIPVQRIKILYYIVPLTKSFLKSSYKKFANQCFAIAAEKPYLLFNDKNYTPKKPQANLCRTQAEARLKVLLRITICTVVVFYRTDERNQMNALDPQYQKALTLLRVVPVLAHLGYSLEQFQDTMLQFAESLNTAEQERSPSGYAASFGDFFSSNPSLSEEDGSWMSLTNASVQYVPAIQPGSNTPQLVKRMHYVSFVGMFRSDLFEGLCVGHAPKKCPICGRWFLTTNARHTKYCGNLAPGDKLHRTCRQIGKLQGRSQRELAADHPIKQIYERRCNTINRYVKRGTLDADIAKRMKKLAKDKMLRALSNVSYAKGCYESEMEQESLLREVKQK